MNMIRSILFCFIAACGHGGQSADPGGNADESVRVGRSQHAVLQYAVWQCRAACRLPGETRDLDYTTCAASSVEADADAQPLCASQFGATVRRVTCTQQIPIQACNRCAGRPDGDSCGDDNACTDDKCVSGRCVSTPRICPDPDQCHAQGVCNPASGICSNPTRLNGAVCDDGSRCTRTDTCQSGVCVGDDPVICVAADQCHVAGVCDPASGVCSDPPQRNGASCNDGSLCTGRDRCVLGTCVGDPPRPCRAIDQCHIPGACDPMTGVCSNPPAANGAGCSDGSLCTLSDSCQDGQCVGDKPVICVASDQCHAAGACNPRTGICTSPAKPNGTGCDDASLCTRDDKCKSGKCVGARVTCVASDQCHVAGVCDPASGVCSDPPKRDGAGCSDGSLCTRRDRCVFGICVADPPRSCVAIDRCHDIGTCNPNTGICSVGGTINCPGSNNPCQVGRCDPGSGCVLANVDNGIPCSDGQVIGACQGGACTAIPPERNRLAAGDLHGLFINDTSHPNEVWAWGSNNTYGQLGVDPLRVSMSARPLRVSGLGDVISVAAGDSFSVALKADGTVWAWGKNDDGQLGNGTQTSSHNPVRAGTLAGITSIAVGSRGCHALALDQAGRLWAWGCNNWGQLGLGSQQPQYTPVQIVEQENNLGQVAPLAPVRNIGAGTYWSLAVQRDGTAWAWGQNLDGQLGDGTTTMRRRPRGVIRPIGQQGRPIAFKSVAGGDQHSLAIDEDGFVWGWGLNDSGRLGDGTTTNRLTAVRTLNLVQVTRVAAGKAHSLALTAAGVVWAWGNGEHGDLGYTPVVDTSRPATVVISPVASVAAGRAFSLALTTSGAVSTWGYNNVGQLGNCTTTEQPTPMPLCPP